MQKFFSNLDGNITLHIQMLLLILDFVDVN